MAELSGPARLEVAVARRSDIERFYEEVLQIEEIERNDKVTVYQLPGLELGFFEADLDPTSVVDGLHFVLEVEDVEALKAAVEAGGGRASGPLKGSDGHRSIFFRDPAGILFKSFDLKGIKESERAEAVSREEAVSVISGAGTSGGTAESEASEAEPGEEKDQVPRRDISHREALTFLRSFTEDLERVRDIMQRLKRKQDPGAEETEEYEALYQKLNEGFELLRQLGLRVENANPWKRLRAFHVYLQKTLPTERSRSRYLDEIFGPVLDRVQPCTDKLARGMTPRATFRNTYVSKTYPGVASAW